MKILVWLTLLLAPLCNAESGSLVLGQSESSNRFRPHINQVTEQIFSLAGISVQVNVLPNERSMVMANHGVIDGEVGRTPNLEASFANLVMIPTALETLDYVVIVLAERACPSLTELNELRGIAIKGLPYFDELIRRYPNNIQFTHSMASIDQMLRTDRGDYSVAPLDVAPMVKKMFDVTFCQIEQPIFTLNTHIYLHEKHAELVGQVDRAVQEYLANTENEAAL